MVHDILIKITLLLFATIFFIPFFKKLGLGAVVGYLTAGIIIGPQVLHLVSDVEAIMHISEFGVVMLLFLIGMELSIPKLWKLRHSIFVVGSLQVLLSFFVFSIPLYFLSLSGNAIVVISMGLALSSTAIALQILKERGLANSPMGQQAFSILLFQDLAIIPMLAILPLLSQQSQSGQSGSGWLELLKVILAIGSIVIFGRFFIRHIFRIIAATGIREVFTAFSLLIVLSVSLLMQQIGLSMGLGAFLAGVLLAESEYRHAIEVDIEPFKGILLGMFFMSVGMSLNLQLVLSSPLLLLGLTLAVLAIKVGIYIILAKITKTTRSDWGIFGLAMCQVGEFAFVLFNMAGSHKILTQDLIDMGSAVVALSMLLSPIILLLVESIQLRRRFKSAKAHNDYDTIASQESSVIIAGFGRVGQVVGRMLNAQKIGVTVLEHDPTQIELVRRFGYKVFYGDASRLDLLEQAQIKKARLLVVAVDDPEASLNIIKLMKEHFKDVPIIARARNRQHVFDLIDLGVTHIIRETFESALVLTREVLSSCGMSPHAAHRAIMRFKEYDESMLLSSAELRRAGGEKALIATASTSRAQLEEIMMRDLSHTDELRTDEWG